MENTTVNGYKRVVNSDMKVVNNNKIVVNCDIGVLDSDKIIVIHYRFSLSFISLFTTKVSQLTATFSLWLAPLINYLPEKQKGYSLPKNRNSLPCISPFTINVSQLTATFFRGCPFD